MTMTATSTAALSMPTKLTAQPVVTVLLAAGNAKASPKTTSS